MAATDEGRRTRSGRNAPVVSPPTTRRSRKTTQSEESQILEEVTGTPIIDTKERSEDEEEVVAPTMVTESPEREEQPMEDDSNTIDDQFIYIPDDNGVANNGIEEHFEDAEPMATAEEEPSKAPEETEISSKLLANEASETNTPAVSDVVAMAADEEDPHNHADETHAVKRKIDSGGGDVEIKKQKTVEKQEAPKEKEPQAVVMAAEEEIVKPPPKLPDLEKYWKPVNEDTTNFTGWTYLLQYVDQETDAEAARDAYNAFLGHYPYCYGYWRKYADYEKNKGDRSKCEEVFERGLRAIPLSVDLWIHYLNYVKASHPDDEPLVRSQYERALDVCGLEFRSDKLWEAYIKWETEAKRLQRVVDIYDRLLKTPTLSYNSHFGSFSDFVGANALPELLTKEQLKELKGQVTASNGVEDEKKRKKAPLSEEEVEEAIKKKMIAARKKVHEATVQEVTNRWTFEEAVKRPYFHVKPLERCQLKNWTDYLDYEIECGDRRRIVVLFERCLIACAMYEDYWQKFVRYLMDGGAAEGEESSELISTTRDVYQRACTIHHKEKPRLHLMWSSFEECQGNIDKAAEILANIDEVSPNLLQIEYRRINVERRRGNLDKCEELFRQYVVAAKNQHVASSLVIKHARFVHKMRNDLGRGLEILRKGQASDPTNVRIPLQMIDLAMQRVPLDEEEVVQILDGVIDKEDLDAEQRVLFAQRKVEFLEDFGNTPKRLQQAQKALQAARATLQEQKKAKSLENNDASINTAAAVPVVAQQQHQHAQMPQALNQYANYSSYYGAGGGTPADTSATSYGSYSDASYYQQYGQNTANNYYANYYQ